MRSFDLLSLFSLIKKVTKKSRKSDSPHDAPRLARIFKQALVQTREICYSMNRNVRLNLSLNVVPGSDSGEVEEGLALRICFNFIRGFVPKGPLCGASFFIKGSCHFTKRVIKECGLHKNHLQEPQGFWLLFAGTKSDKRLSKE